MLLGGMLLTMIVSLLIRGGEGLRFGLTLLWLLPPVLLLLRRRERVKSGVSGIPSTGDGSVPDVHFSDVAANEEALESMCDLVSFIQSPEKYSRFGARIPRGVLLYGAPGTGKTLLARALAGEAGVPFFAVNGADFVEMYVGVGASRVRALFQKARKAGAMIPFVKQDMRQLHLHRQMDAVLCTNDGVNYLRSEDELRQFFQAAHRVLREGGGLFLDLSTPYKLRRVLGNHFIGDEDENIAYLWQNRYHEQQNCVEMNLAIFVRQEGETYLRIGEQQRQYAHTAETLGTLLHECGFTDVAVFGDKHMEAPGEKECRWFVAARKPLGGAEV